MLEQAKHRNGARLFINWLISREGQLLTHAVTFAAPVHKALQKREFVALSEELLDKPTVELDEEILSGPSNKRMLKLWNAYWGR